MQFVLPLRPLSFCSLRFITFLGSLHREVMRRLGFHRWQRQELLEVFTLTLRTNGNRFEDQRLESVPALFALKIEDRHSRLQ